MPLLTRASSCYFPRFQAVLSGLRYKDLGELKSFVSKELRITTFGECGQRHGASHWRGSNVLRLVGVITCTFLAELSKRVQGLFSPEA